MMATLRKQEGMNWGLGPESARGTYNSMVAELFVTERNGRVDSRGAAGGNPAGGKSDHQQQNRDADKCGGILRIHLVEKFAEVTGQSKRGGDSEGTSDDRELQSRRKHLSPHRSAGCAQSHADSDLPGPASDPKGDHGIQTSHPEQKADDARRAYHLSHDPRRQQAV